MFFFILFVVHLQAVIVPILIGLHSVNKFRNFKNQKLIPFGFIFLGFASLAEMIDHANTSWIYVDHSSLFNWLFYSFLSLGLTSLSISVIKNKVNISILLFLSFSSIVSYILFGKIIALFFQVIISIFLIVIWQKIFKDWLLILYPIFGIFLTTLFGTNLTVSGNQFWHILIGPSGTISVLTFYIILKRGQIIK